MKKPVIIAAGGALAAVFLVLALAGGWHQAPLLDTSRRNPVETVRDFIWFSWHYSRHIWLEESRHWKDANRQKLLAFWYRPGYAGFKELREKSFFELGCLYQRLSLPGRASDLLIQACRREPEKRWIARRAGAMIIKMRQWDKLEELSRFLLESDPGNRQARLWLEMSGRARRSGKN
jgi:hypothetical protein